MATLREIRQAIGFNLPGSQPRAMQRYKVAAGSTNTVIRSDELTGANDVHAGKYVVINEPDTKRELIDLTREVDGNSVENKTLTLAGALPVVPQAGWTFELWAAEFPPDVIANYVNQALGDANTRSHEPMSADTLYLGPEERVMRPPLAMEYLSRVEVLQANAAHDLMRSNTQWPVEVVKDTASLQLEVRVVPSNTEVRVQFEALHPARWSHVAAVGYSYGNLRNLSMGTTSAGKEAAALPPDQGRGWFHLQVPIAGGGVVDSVFIEGDGQFALAELNFIDEEAEDWKPMPYSIHLGTRTVSLRGGYYGPQRVRLLGGRRFEPLEHDLDESPVVPEFLVNQATGLALMGLGAEDGEASLAGPWFRRAKTSYLSIPAYDRAQLR